MSEEDLEKPCDGNGTSKMTHTNLSIIAGTTVINL
jgi:hypothetical protein